jgi:hypothetical protein
MTLPADVVTVPVIGTWLDGTGAPCSGKVIFSPQVATRLVHVADNRVIMPERSTVLLDASGSISTSLIATDQASLAGVGGFTWTAAVLINDSTGQQVTPYSFAFPVPSGTIGAIDITNPTYALSGTSNGLPPA